jgi:hypothetical protein
MAREDDRYKVLRERLYRQYQASVRPAAAILVLFGILLMAAWYLTNDGSTMSSLLMLVGLSIIVLGFMLYVLSPETYVRGEVADALALSNTLDVGKMLSSLLMESKGIYLPEGTSRLLRVFIPVSKEMTGAEIAALEPKSETLSSSASGMGGLYLMPPGYGLFKYSQSIGAVFTPEGLENEIKDVLENGLELASSVDVKQDDVQVVVSMSRLANGSLCSAVRKESPQICAQIGCPICSFVGCMVVSGTGRKARIESIDATDHNVKVIFKLL